MRERSPARARPGVQRGEGLLPWLLGVAEALSSHRLLDRLIRGRLWIGIVAFALLGIVTLQLGLLKMNSGIGRALERSAELQRENAALSIENSELTSGERVESEAAGKLGMRLASVSALKPLASHERTDLAQAAAALQSAAARSAATSSESAASSEGEGEAASSASSTPGESGSGESHASEAASTESSSGPGTGSAGGEAGTGGEAGEGSSSASSGASGEASTGSGQSTPAAGEAEGGPGGGTAAPGG